MHQFEGASEVFFENLEQDPVMGLNAWLSQFGKP